MALLKCKFQGFPDAVQLGDTGSQPIHDDVGSCRAIARKIERQRLSQIQDPVIPRDSTESILDQSRCEAADVGVGLEFTFEGDHETRPGSQLTEGFRRGLR